MLYIRFLNLQNPLQDVEQLYKDGTIEQGDIVCQQYTDKYSRLFMNGTWVKTKYISKIAQNTEVEDDVKTLYDSIVNTSTMLNDTSIRLNNVSTRLNDTSIRLNDVSTRLNDTSVRLLNYLTINQYLKDEELIASTFADINNKINAQTELLDNNSTNITDISTKLSNYLTIEQYLKDEKLIARAFIDLDDRINAQTELIDNNSTNIADISTNIADISTKLSNYLTKTQYLKDEKLIASTFADVNNKINSLYAEIAELKEQLNSSTK